MALYPGSDSEQRYEGKSLQHGARDIFVACGMGSDDAATVAQALVEADLRGIHSHGLIRIPDYVHKLLDGGVDPRGTPRVASQRGGAVTVDGANAMGPVVAKFAMGEAIRRARKHAVAVVAARGSNHCGALDHWVMMAAREEQIGIAATNALPTMAPWGGLDKIVGMNPLGIAIPGDNCEGLVMDLAFGATAHGKIRVYAQKGEAIPAHWAFDTNGEPTTDAAAALDGLIQPVGEHKGVALAILFGALSTVLSGASYGTDLGNMVQGPTPGADGHIFMAMDIEAFRPLAEVKAHVDRIVNEITTSQRQAGVESILAPGQLESTLSTQRREGGIPLNEETVNGIRACAARLDVNVDEALR